MRARKQIFHEICRKQCKTSSTWGQVTHVCVRKIYYVITGEDNGVTPVRCEAIFLTGDGLLSIEQTSVRFAHFCVFRLFVCLFLFSSNKIIVYLSVCWQYPLLVLVYWWSNKKTSSICVSWHFLSLDHWLTKTISSLEWGHNGLDSISNHQPHDYLLNRLFRRRLK